MIWKLTTERSERVRPYFAKLRGNVNQPADCSVLKSSNLIIYRQVLPALCVVPQRTAVNNRIETALKINCEAKTVWNKSTNTDTV